MVVGILRFLLLDKRKVITMITGSSHNMNDNIKWNYNMDEAPKDGTDVLVSDGMAIWIAYNTIGVWHCTEGLLYINFIAWAPLNLPRKKELDLYWW